jgi:O-antigen ligase
MLSVSLVMAVYLATNETKFDRRFRWLYWCYIGAAALGTALTGSRGGLFCLVMAALFAMRLTGVKRFKLVMRYGIRFAVIAAITYFLVPRVLISRFGEAFGGADTFTQREGYWLRGLEYGFVRYPMQGVGLGSYSHAITAMSGEKTGVAHNIAMSVLVELGLIGAVLFIAMVIIAYRTAWRMPSRESWLTLGMLTVWLVGAMSSGSQIDKFSWFVQALVATMGAACPRARPARQPNPAAAAPMRLPARGLRPRWGKS